MQGFTTNVLSDTFDNLHDMAQAMSRPPNAPASSSPTAIAAFALDILSQPIERWDENGTLRMSSDDPSPQGRLNTLERLVGQAETEAMVDFWREEKEL